MTYSPPPSYQPPTPPRKNHTNAIIIGGAAALIIAIVGTGLFAAQSRDGNEPVSATPTESAAAEPQPSASLSPECRTWIKSELLDSTGEIEATPGYEACGDLSEEELDAAIEQVTEELSAAITPSVP